MSGSRETGEPDAAGSAGGPGAARAPLIAALCLVVSVAYGALYYGFAVLITEPAAGGDFSRGLLSAAYGGAVLTGGAAAIPVGRAADRFGVRWLIAGGALLGAAGLLGFAAAGAAWQVLAVWWLVLGPASALTFYEPAYVAIQQGFAAADRARAIGVLTLAAGLSGPVFTPATGALVEALGWRDTTRVLAAAMACAAPAAALLVRVRPVARERGPRGGGLGALRERRVQVFTVGAVLAYGAVEALVVHRVARFQELGFGLATVTAWAAISGLVTLPGRFLLPVLARRTHATVVFAGVLVVLAASAALMIGGDGYGQMALSFVVFGLVFGSALPLRAVVMGEWTATAVFGTVMGAQAALIALGRAAGPAAAGALHDGLGGYTLAMALITATLVAAAVLVLVSGRR
ncbi:MAG TPA: MFS transporter [Solirubrobacter sp.]|nr:MFS transporter [Solirubrobacter sp.]